MIGSIYWHTSKPNVPNIGDAYYDDTTFNSYVYNGMYWCEIGRNTTSVDANIKEEKSLLPTEKDLEECPSLKAAWEEYVLIKKLSRR